MIPGTGPSHVCTCVRLCVRTRARARACKQNSAITRGERTLTTPAVVPSGVSWVIYLKLVIMVKCLWLHHSTPFRVCRPAMAALHCFRLPGGTLRCLASCYIPATCYRKTESFTASLYVVAMEDGQPLGCLSGVKDHSLFPYPSGHSARNNFRAG